VNEPGEITVLLSQWSDGKQDALAPLFELIYPKLRQMAGSLFQDERAGHVLQPTGVVNEFYLKFVRQQKLRFEDREHFFSLAARLMRRILVDYARQRQSVKRDFGTPVALREESAWADARPGADLVDIDRALEELRKIDERKCKIIDLRFFLGFTAEEAAEILGSSKATVDRELRFARGWIQDRLAAAERPSEQS
jgi:RNA polymerase sigma factor (TIGR02999 family)